MGSIGTNFCFKVDEESKKLICFENTNSIKYKNILNISNFLYLYSMETMLYI